MKRATILLCLLFVLTACTAPGQATQDPRASPGTPTTPPAQSTAASAFESSVLLARRGEDERRYEIRLVDPATGQDAPGYPPIIVGRNNQFISPHTLSADGKILAAIESQGQSCEPSAGGTACRASADVLHLVDLQTWREATATLSSGRGWIELFTFNPDTTRLALAYNEPKSSIVMLFDAVTGQLLGERSLDFRPSLMGHSPDGTALVVYGQPLGADPGISQPDPPRVLLLDAVTLEVMWDQPLPSILSGEWCLENCEASHEEQSFAYWRPAVVLSPDGRKLYIVHADEEKLTTVDLQDRAVQSIEFREAQSWLESLLALTAGVAEAKGGLNGTTKEAALSPDGTRLYVLARTYTNGPWGVSLGLQVVDVESGRKIAQQDSEGIAIKMTPDGAYLLLLNHTPDNRWWTDVLDAESLQPVAQLEDRDVMVTRRMNGQPLFVAQTIPERATRLAVLDPRSFDIVHSWAFNGYASWITNP